MDNFIKFSILFLIGSFIFLCSTILYNNQLISRFTYGYTYNGFLVTTAISLLGMLFQLLKDLDDE